MINNAHSRMWLRLPIAALVLLGVWNIHVEVAQAITWQSSSNGYCYGGPYTWVAKGYSELRWQGGWPWDSGNTWGYLWMWNGSAWVQASTGYGSASGTGNVAAASPGVDLYSGTPRYTWNETGAHTATFFAGQQNSYSSDFACP